MPDRHIPDIDSATIAVVGLGRMGAAMATRLLDAGTSVAVYNRTQAKADPFVERGAQRLDSLADASRCDVVLSMVTDDAALDDLHDPATGLFAGGAAPAVWVDSSTVSVDAADRARAAAAEAGVAFVAAPVSGNPGVVSAGNAIFAISGDPDALELVEQILLRIGRGVWKVGTGTEATVIKLCVNAVLAITMQSLSEVAVLADRAGVARAALMDFLNDSAIGSPFSKYKTENIVGLQFPPTFTATGQRKDVRLALDLSRDLEVPMPVLTSTEVAYSRLIASGTGDGRDFSALILEVARDAGHTLQPE